MNMQVDSSTPTTTPNMRSYSSPKLTPHPHNLLSTLFLLFVISLSLPLENCIPIRIEFQFRDTQIGGTDPNGSTSTIDLFLCYAFDMDDPLLAVNGCNTPFTTFEVPSSDYDFVVFADRD